MTPERPSPSERQPPASNFISLKELVPLAEEMRFNHPGPPISERVLFLADYIETEGFWLELNRHLANDTVKRQSVGGVFCGEYGTRSIDHYCSWYHAFASLDHFLKDFERRATEFIFRDFRPVTDDPRVADLIIATRKLAFDKYPRLRRLYWDDYQEALETPVFWQQLLKDLARLDDPVNITTFFPKQALSEREPAYARRETAGRTQIVIRSKDGKILFIDYAGLGQIIRDAWGIDPRSFLLNYSPEDPDSTLASLVSQAKTLVETKLLPLCKMPEPIRACSEEEFFDRVNDPYFWQQLLKDIEAHTKAGKQTFSLGYFLRYFNRERGQINESRPGSYVKLITFWYEEPIRRFDYTSAKPAQKLVNFLMWQFVDVPEELKPIVGEVKALCAEMFPHDCLYVALQTNVFWEGFQKDISQINRPGSFCQFLRYFSRSNPDFLASHHLPETSKYRKFLFRAYHYKGELRNLLKQLMGKKTRDYKEALAELFWVTSPEETKLSLKEKFPKEFAHKQHKHYRQRQK